MLKQNQQPPFPSQPLPQSPFEQQLQDIHPYQKIGRHQITKARSPKFIY